MLPKNVILILLLNALHNMTYVIANPSNKSTSLNLIILHNNDMHARFEQTAINSNQCQPEDVLSNKCYGGFARVAYTLKKFRTEAENGGTPVLYLNAGDTYTGTPWFTLYKDKIITEFLNILKPDAISLGNHEFDLNIKGLVPFLNEAHFPILAANLNTNKTPELMNTVNLKKSVVFTIKGVLVGVIGYLTPETKALAPPNDVEYIDEIEAINIEANILKLKGVQILIALGHSGYETDKNIAAQCPDIDIVIGGHSNTFLYTGNKPDIEKPEAPYPSVITQSNGKKVPVVQAYAYTKYLGHINLSFDEHGNLKEFNGEPILLNGSVPRDPDVLKILEKYRPGIESMHKEVLADSKVYLDGSCRQKECNLGNFITDSMVYTYSKAYHGEFWTDAAIAFLQGGGIRSSGSIGNITMYDLTTILPFNDVLVATEVSGTTILEVLEKSVERYSKTTGYGEFLQMSGVQVIYNLTKDSGSRVESVKILCANCAVPTYYELEEKKTYKIILTKFLYDGGDGYEMFSKYEEILLEIPDIDSVANYLKSLKLVYPAVEWRITLNGEVIEDEDDGANQITFSVLLMVFSIYLAFINTS